VPCGIVAITTQTWGFSLGLGAERQDRQHRSKEAGNDPQHHDHQPRCPVIRAAVEAASFAIAAGEAQ